MAQSTATAPPSWPITTSAFAPTTETWLRWLGGAGFLINTHGQLVAIDPVLAYQPGTTDP
jgi:hypothetical protein